MVLVLADLALAVIGTLVSAIAVHTRARDLIGPVIGLPLLIPALIATAAGPARCCAGAHDRLAPRASGWRSWLFMIWCSHCSPTRCSTSCWRTEVLSTIYGRGLRGLAIATVVMISVAFALVFFYAPLDADQGFIQKIFYLHVPLAIVSLCGFVFGGLLAVGHLRTGDRRWDMRSYVAIHMALIFGIGGADHRARSGPRRPGATGGCGASRRWSRS